MGDSIAHLAVLILPVVLAITLHEAAHGYAALRFGDPTAKLAGRISANPLRHIDPVGTVAVPLLIYFMGALAGHDGLLFGWAKPVPVNFGRLRNPKKDMLWVAAAGPGANFLMALGWGLLFKFAVLSPDGVFAEPLRLMAQAGMTINCVLMVLNLLPVPPLDGGRILVSLLPLESAMRVARVEPYGLFIVMFLVFFPPVRDHVFLPLFKFAIALLNVIIYLL